MKKIQILGTGCKKCNDLAETAKNAAEQIKMEFGVMTTPALVVDGDVKVTGKVPTIDEIKKYLS